MKTFRVLLLQVLSISLAAATVEWDNLLVKWALPTDDPSRSNSFFETPRTRSDAISAGWVQVTGVNPNMVTSYSLTDDPRFIVLFDWNGIIAGVQFGILVSDVADIQNVTQLSASNWYQVKTIYGVDVWTLTVYTQDPATIASGGRSSTWDNLTGTDGVWIETTDGCIEIPRNLEDLEDPIWAKQSCIPTMGLHYFYNMFNDSACPDLAPVFLLYRNNTVSGVGMRVAGKLTTKDRSWYEELPTVGIRLTIPNGPQCLYDWSDEYGITTMHVFFTSEPWNVQGWVKCIFQAS